MHCILARRKVAAQVSYLGTRLLKDSAQDFEAANREILRSVTASKSCATPRHQAPQCIANMIRLSASGSNFMQTQKWASPQVNVNVNVNRTPVRSPSTSARFNPGDYTSVRYLKLHNQPWNVPEYSSTLSSPVNTPNLTMADFDNSEYDEKLAYLRAFETIFLVDDSAAMAPHWDQVKELLDNIAPICAKHDPDGIDIYFVNHRPKGFIEFLPGQSVRKSGYRRIGGFTQLQTKDSVAQVFTKVAPAGKCTLGARLNKLLTWYCNKVKKDTEFAGWNLIILTAGKFDDDVKAPLSETAKKLDEMQTPDHQLGIQLLQLGNDAAVSNELKYLDDELHRTAKTRDIIDATAMGTAGSLGADDMLKVVLGGVVKKLDECKAVHGQIPVKHVDLDD